MTWAAWNPVKGQPHYEHADVVGFNEYRGFMDPFEDLAPDVDATSAANPGKPLVVLENGAWAIRGRRGGVDEPGSEDWQADLMVRQHRVLADRVPPMAGYTYWILMDYRGNPTRALPTPTATRRWACTTAKDCRSSSATCFATSTGEGSPSVRDCEDRGFRRHRAVRPLPDAKP